MISAVSHIRVWRSLQICVWLSVAVCSQNPVRAESAKPILISTPTSTRAVALEATSLTTEPFSATTQSSFYSTDTATRLMLFALDLSLQAGEDASAVRADAEDAAHHHYSLKVGYVGKVPGLEWLIQVNLRLDESMGDVGDVLVRITYQGVASNRVRIGIGHVGGGLPDDEGAAPTPAPPYDISGRITSGATGVGGVVVALGGAQTGTTKTDNNGVYSFTVSSVGDYTITPSKNFYTFAPPARTFNDLSGNRSANFEAVPITFTISGQARDEENRPLSGATITLSGAQQGTTTTDEQGSFVFRNLMGGGSFEVTASETDYAFSPASLSFNNLSADQTVSFSGSLVSYQISGRVADSGGNGLSVAPVRVSNGATVNTVTTNESGVYTISLKAHGDYTITPSPQIIESVPTQLIFTFLNANQTAANFTASRKLYTFGGQVRDDQGNGLDGIAVTLTSSASGSSTKVVNTSNGGLFSFPDLPAGFAYTATPASNSLYIFTTQGTNVLDGNLSLNFNGTRRKYAIHGVMTDGEHGLDGISVTITGGNNPNPFTVMTSGGGQFAFPDVTAGYDYTVTPVTTAFYTFKSQDFKNLLSDQNAVFKGTLRSYTVSGLVTDENNNPLSSGTVALYSGNYLVETGTNIGADGRYEFKNVPALYSYTVYPYYVSTHYFTAKVIPSLSADQTLNFTGIRYNFKISGVVSDRSQQGLNGVSVTLSGGASRSATTDANGNYSFDNLPAGFDYSVAVAKTDYIFEPQSRSYYLLRDVASDFTGIRTYRFSGHVTDGNGHGLIGITMSLSGAETGKVLTGSDGSYSFTVTTIGNYLLTPSKDQNFYTFNPTNQAFNSLNDHQTANFTAAFSPATNPSYVLEFDGSPMTVDYGLFWPEGPPLGHFFCEFWAMPGQDTYTRYLLSDGYGGAHALL
ncbi:MAG TPA: carboxypeptidase-like regulatory domain-containing protein, partial [Pyrinomonadaceae bacterium]|nr:carboxypeptidase-like regulatory domain-containing protein [Pyrinomonadaceae bacterium]